jgi:hypothetical protein
VKTQNRLISWRAIDGGHEGKGPSETLWTLRRTGTVWALECREAGDGGRAETPARASEPRPLLDAALCSEAIWLGRNGAKLDTLSLEFILSARVFAIAQRESLIAEMKALGFDPTGAAGPREDWMKQEISSYQAAIYAFEREAVDRGWKLTSI